MMKRTSTVNDLAPKPHCIWHTLALLVGLGVCMPSLVQAEEGLSIEDTYDPGHDESYSYGAPWYSRGQEELDRTYGRRDGRGDYDSGPSSTERRKAAERREKEQQETFRRQDRQHVAAHEAMCQQQLPALTDAVRIHRESFETLQSQVRCNVDVTRVAFTADTFVETYGVVGQLAEQVQTAEAVLEAQLEASAMLAPPLGPEQADVLGMAVQGAPFETRASMEGWDALIVTSVQHQEASAQVSMLQYHVQERTALLDSAALFIAGADRSFAEADASTGYSLLRVAQGGLDLALTVGSFIPAVYAAETARTLAGYVSGFDLVTRQPIDFDAVDAVGVAMALIPGGKPFAKISKYFGKIAKTEGRLGSKMRQLWVRLSAFKGENSGPEIVGGLEKAGQSVDVKVAEYLVKEDQIVRQVLGAKRPQELPLKHFVESATKKIYGEETSAGRALRKHGNRPKSAYPNPKGNSDVFNITGRKIAEEILSHPRNVLRHRSINGAPVVEIYHPDGRGIAFHANGRLRGFLEPAN